MHGLVTWASLVHDKGLFYCNKLAILIKQATKKLAKSCMKGQG